MRYLNRQAHDSSFDIEKFVFQILYKNTHLEEVAWILKKMSLSGDFLLAPFLKIIHLNLNYSQDFSIEVLTEYVDQSNKEDFYKSLKNDLNPLLTEGLIELASNGAGFLSTDKFKLTNTTTSFFIEQGTFNLISRTSEVLKIENFNDIIKTKLFYNSENEVEINTISQLLKKKNFNRFRENAINAGIPVGITIILFIGPGTGKTEIVLQLARKSKRNLFSLNLSQIRDKYVGEPEKKIMCAFNHYNYVLNYSSGLAPILLFNEADAILGNRLKTRTSIDKMENSLQNIILDFIERFEGILIRTTNLTGNLDKSFERRFLFKKKIAFSKCFYKNKNYK